MQLANHTVDEQSKVEAWRLQQLLNAGYTNHRANTIANNPNINLHTALDLIRHGCPQTTALKILT